MSGDERNKPCARRDDGPGSRAVDDLLAKVSGEAYQIIGLLAHDAGLFDHPAVVRALDYFGYEQWRKPGAEILPWHLEDQKEPSASSETGPGVEGVRTPNR